MKKSPNLRVQLAPRHAKGLVLSNPVMIAGGIAGYGIEYAEIADIQRLGAVVCKGTTLMPRRGNTQPRLVETAGGVLNSVGLENIGIDALIREKAPVWAGWQVPVIVNVAGETIDEYVAVSRELEGVPGVSAIELNVSCPNIEDALEFIMAGATAIQVGTACLTSPDICLTILEGIKRFMRDKGVENLTDLIGVAQDKS